MAAPEEIPASPPRRKKRRTRWKSLTWKILGATLFFLGLYGSIRLGMNMAMEKIASKGTTETSPTETPAITLGRPGDPVYLAPTPDALRAFFADFDSPGRRASADLTGLTVRRITSPLQLQTTRVEADAVEMKVLSGPFAGTVYWVHHSQMPDPSKFDPILSPVPGGAETSE